MAIPEKGAVAPYLQRISRLKPDVDAHDPASARRACKPQFETYSLPSGPNVIAVGQFRPEAILSHPPEAFKRTSIPLFAVNGAGAKKPVNASSAYRRPAPQRRRQGRR